MIGQNVNLKSTQESMHILFAMADDHSLLASERPEYNGIGKYFEVLDRIYTRSRKEISASAVKKINEQKKVYFKKHLLRYHPSYVPTTRDVLVMLSVCKKIHALLLDELYHYFWMQKDEKKEDIEEYYDLADYIKDQNI